MGNLYHNLLNMPNSQCQFCALLDDLTIFHQGETGSKGEP